MASNHIITGCFPCFIEVWPGLAALPVDTINFGHITCTLQRQGPGMCDARTGAQNRDLHQDTWFDWETRAGSRELNITLLFASGPMAASSLARVAATGQ